MELEITTSIYIDIDYIIEINNIDNSFLGSEVRLCVEDYVNGMDDCDYCLIGHEEKEKIVNAIVEKVGAQVSLFN